MWTTSLDPKNMVQGETETSLIEWKPALHDDLKLTILQEKARNNMIEYEPSSHDRLNDEVRRLYGAGAHVTRYNFFLRKIGRIEYGLLDTNIGKEVWYKRTSDTYDYYYQTHRFAENWHDFVERFMKEDIEWLENINTFHVIDGDNVRRYPIEFGKTRFVTYHQKSNVGELATGMHVQYLLSRLEEITNRLEKMEEQMIELYNAPGMPGFVQSAEHFCELQQASQSQR